MIKFACSFLINFNMYRILNFRKSIAYIAVASLVVTACRQDDMLNSNDNSFGSEREVTFDKVNNALSFSSRDQLKGYVKEKIPNMKVNGAVPHLR
ncbi:hypothetical protein JSO61_003260 [Riemerella anatipestifer]|uniref:hypothetical protein n=2 Tax=Weeksellaceae TaxID=2762318 RepID=UPI0030BDD170